MFSLGYRLRLFLLCCWALLGGLAACVLFVLLIGIMNPIGGGEMHFMFAYRDDGGSLGFARIVFVQYLITIAFVSGILRWSKYPLPWYGRAAVVSLIACALWLRYPLYPRAGVAFRVQAFALMALLVMAAFGVALRSEKVRLRRLRAKEA